MFGGTVGEGGGGFCAKLGEVGLEVAEVDELGFECEVFVVQGASG